MKRIEEILMRTNLTFQIAAPQGDYSNEKYRAVVSKKRWQEGSPYDFDLNADSLDEIVERIIERAIELRPNQL